MQQEVVSDKVDIEPTKRNWWSFNSLLLMQTQNVFNDKSVQFLLVCTAQALVQIGTDNFLTNTMQYLLGAIIVTPFILFAPLAGWLSDRFPKSQIIKFSSLFQLAIFSLLVLAMHLQSLELLVSGFFLLAIQSSILSPAKLGIIKELVGKRNLGYASGMLEMLTILGILGGSIIMSHWYGNRLGSDLGAWESLKLPMYVLLFSTPIALLGAFMVQQTKVKNLKKFKLSICFDHYRQVMNLLRRRELRLSSVAVTYFWIFGGFIQLLSLQIANEASGKSAEGIGPDLANMMLVAGVGIAFGSVIASLVSKIRIELGLIPLGGVIMAISCFCMAGCTMLSFWFMAWMFISGIGAALFLVPVNAYLQDSCEESERGDVLAANNLLNCIGGIAAVAIQGVMYLVWGWSAQLQFVILGVVTIIATVYAMKLLPSHFVRFCLLMAVRVVYRIRIENDNNLPKRGGVLMVPNHISFIDAFIISAASPRPVRFLIFDEYYKKKWAAWFLHMFDAVPISKSKAKEAIQLATDAILEGGVVCIFPEGQLTRTGSLNEVKRGFEMIARKAKCPVVPVYMDGLWGSIFSFERGKFIKKKPYHLKYGVTVAFAKPLGAKQATNVKVKHSLMSLAGQSIQTRKWVTKSDRFASYHVKVREGNPRLVIKAKEQVCMMEDDDRKSLITNALQVVDSPMIPRESYVAVMADELEEISELILFAVPVVNKNTLVIIEDHTKNLKELEEKYGITTWIGGDKLFAKMHSEGLDSVLFHIGGKTETTSYGWWCESGRVLAVQMPNLPAPSPAQLDQIGNKEGTRGRLLTGFTIEDSRILDGYGNNLASNDSIDLDPDGFVIEV